MCKNSLQDAGKRRPRRFPVLAVLCVISVVATPLVCRSQLGFASAVSMAVQTSARVRTAQLDLRKAQANLSLAKDMFVPSLAAGGGLGWTYGITLTVPTIFTINAQSLVYSNQQRFAIRAAHADLEAAQFVLTEARQQTEEDAAITYINLDENRRVLESLAQQHESAEKLVVILENRVKAGLDSDLEMKKARRAALQIELQQMQAEDDRSSLVAHLSELTGLPASEVATAPDPIPAIPDPAPTNLPEDPLNFTSPGLRAAEATVRGKLERARGDAGYTWKPIITFGAQYGRVSPINDVSSFYNLHGNYNTANIGVQFSFPMLDKVRSEAARISLADATRAEIDLAHQHVEESAGRLRLRRSVRLAATKAQIAELDYGIAQDELKSTLVQLHAASGSSPLTPKEEQNARMQERQKYLDLLDAELQLKKTQIVLLRQTGQLDGWISTLINASPKP